MKKALSIMFALLLLFLLPACGGDEEEDDWGNDGDGGNTGNNEENGGWESQEDQDYEILKFEDDLSKAYFQQIAIGLNNEIYVAGYTYDNLYAELNGKNDPFLLAIDSKGKKLWGKQWGVPVIRSSNNDVSGMSVDTDGNIYVTIYGNPSVAKFSPEGTKTWEIFPDLKGDDMSTLTLDKFDNIYVGVEESGVGIRENNVNIIKYSNQSKELQRYNISGDSSDFASIRALAVDSEGNIYAGGYTYGSLFADNVGKRDAFLVKIAPDGTQLWGQQWGSDGDDGVKSILIGTDNAIFITSYVSYASMEAFFKFSPDGDKIWGIKELCGSVTMCGGNIYCTIGKQIYKYNIQGESLGVSALLEKLGTIACDSKENIYVLSHDRLIKILASSIE